jgi:hypothetical protein
MNTKSSMVFGLHHAREGYSIRGQFWIQKMERRIQKRSIPGALLCPDGDERYSTRISQRSAVKAEESLNAEIAQVKLSDLFLGKGWLFQFFDHAPNSRLRRNPRLPNHISSPVSSQMINPINKTIVVLKNIAPATCA